MRRDGIWFAEKDQAGTTHLSFACGFQGTQGSADREGISRRPVRRYSLSGWHRSANRGARIRRGSDITSRYKKPRPLVRDQRTFPADANLLVIATEDTYLPAQYFDLFRNPRVKVQVLPTEDCRSSPEHVMDRLASFTREYQLADDDELWLMLDTDHWIGANHIATFANACTQAMKSGVGLAHSNPCFELWLLLHVADLSTSEEFAKCADDCQRVRVLTGECGKRRLNPVHFSLATAAAAVARAENLDSSPDDRWPQRTGTHVYKIVKRLLE